MKKALVSLALCFLCALPTAGCASTQQRRPAVAPAPAGFLVPSLQRDMHAIASRLEASGWRAGRPGLAGFLLAGSHAMLALRIPAGQCVTIVARATENARDVDAALYAAEGRLLALDSEPNAHPTVQACAADTDVRAYYVIQFYEGDGSFVAIPFFGARSLLPSAAAAVGGRPAFAEVVAAPEVAEEPIAAFNEGLRKRGYDEVGEPRHFSIAEGEHVRESLPVEAGQCYTVAAFGGRGISALSLRLLDARGAELSADDDRKPQAATQLCAHESATYALESSAVAGAGEVQLYVYRVDVVTAGGEAGLWLGHRPSEPALTPAAKQPGR